LAWKVISVFGDAGGGSSSGRSTGLPSVTSALSKPAYVRGLQKRRGSKNPELTFEAIVQTGAWSTRGN
jgi:hypothetical protein